MRAETIIYAVCNAFQVKRRDLIGVTRRSEIVEARQVAFYLQRELLKSSYRTIGKLLIRDHTTVGFGCRKMERRVKTDRVMRQKVSKLKKALLRKHS